MINLLDPERIKKERVALIGFLRGAKMNAALAILYFAEKYHNGKRKDGVTPEFAHQVQIALYLSTLNLESDQVEVAIIAALAHDLFEDNQNLKMNEVARQCGFSFVELIMEKRPLNYLYSKSIHQGLLTALVLSKIIGGVKIPQDQYLDEVSKNPIAALVKGADRMNNFQTMSGVFSCEKQSAYLDEGMGILACVKAARKRFPFMSNAFFNVEHMLKAQIELISILLNIHPTRKAS